MYVPKGMKIGDFEAHPVRKMIGFAAYGGSRGLPSRDELDALNLPTAQRDKVLTACKEVAAVNDGGEHSSAWTLGEERAAEIIGALPDELRDPQAFHADPHAAIAHDPAALARLVPRR